MQYRHRYTNQILQDLKENGVRTLPYHDIFDGNDYLQAVYADDIQDEDITLVLSIDGAQLYQYKVSDCWIYIWLIMDLAPGICYKKKNIIPGGFIPGPNKPKNLNSFIFTGLFHLAAIQAEGLRIWSALTGEYFVSYPYLLL